MAAFTSGVQDTAALTRLTLAPGSDNVEKVDANSRATSIFGRFASRGQTWTIERLEAEFGGSNQPVWIHRAVGERLGPRFIPWANYAALQAAGPPRTSEACTQFLASAPPPAQDVSLAFRKLYVDNVQEKGEILRFDVHLAKAMSWYFTQAPDMYGTIQHEPIRVLMNGEDVICNLAHLEKYLKPDELRSATVAASSPLHSYLFDARGCLLYANQNAVQKWHAHGFKDMKRFKLEDLFLLNGTAQPTIAQEALAAIFARKEPHFAATLTSASKGKTRHTAFEMWPAMDPVENYGPACVVTSMDVTPLKQTELELRSLKLALQRRALAPMQQNNDLQQQVQHEAASKAGLEAAHVELQARLQEALKLHMVPRTPFTSNSPVDRTVELLENLMEGRMPSTEEMVSLRNTLLQSDNLRRPDLEHQLQASSGMTEEANRSLIALLQDDYMTATKQLTEKLSPTALNLKREWRKHSSNYGGSSRETRSEFSFREPAASEAALKPGHAHPDCRAVIASHSIRPISERMLQEACEDWAFDVWKLEEAVDGHALSCLGFYLFQQHGLIERFSMREDTLATFLMRIEEGYSNANPYHNRAHAACVLHMTNLLMFCPEGLWDCGIVEELLVASMYLAAVCHDFAHPGVTNEFLTKTRHPVAIVYNDRSPLESHHAAASFQVMFSCGDLFPAATQASEFQMLRATIIDLILATDMKNHFSLVSRLQGAFQCGAFTSPKLVEASYASGDTPAASVTALTPANSLLAMQCALKCADIGHLALPLQQHQEWVRRLGEEFHLQGDRERNAGLAISPLMDRTKANNLGSSQVGFFEVIFFPLAKSLVTVTPGAQNMLNFATNNYYKWRTLRNNSEAA